ncbi:MAG TPA: hypothetical protein VN946_18525 [Terriglobales bacterium]|jgi:hypothetical protein|nr:hypothetical protein [Terriglobales bacterium]
MAIDTEFQKKLQIFLLVAIVVAGGRAAYVVYERHEAMKEDTAPKQERALNADYYVTPKRLHAYDLTSAREQLMQQPVWVKYGDQLTYYPYNAARHKTDFAHEAGTLAPLQKLAIQDVVADVAPQVPGTKQVVACFLLEGKAYAVPIGAEKEGDFKLRAGDIFYIEDPRDLYKHWPAAVWQKIDAHEVQSGMSELQASFAIGMGIPEGSGDYGSRTLHYPNAGKPLVITFENDKAVEIKPGT